MLTFSSNFFRTDTDANEPFFKANTAASLDLYKVVADGILANH
jgi:hypothetical protein